MKQNKGTYGYMYGEVVHKAVKGEDEHTTACGLFLHPAQVKTWSQIRRWPGWDGLRRCKRCKWEG